MKANFITFVLDYNALYCVHIYGSHTGTLYGMVNNPEYSHVLHRTDATGHDFYAINEYVIENILLTKLFIVFAKF